ncbi:laccase domain-containing protein, partial [Moritella sp.]|uniref:laccase domain-containing protein n=1 Tax=Moritella sp. TaxID=78556 RepID=UPI0025DFCF1F
MPRLIQPNWPAPSNVKALSTTRQGGVSHVPYAGLNLGLHVQADSQVVWRNR